MSRIIVPRRDLILPQRHKQRGFICLPAGLGLGAPMGGGSDPLWASVASLLKFPGADGSVSFTDEKGFGWSPSGNAQVDTGQSKFGGSSLLLDGAGDYLIANNNALAFTTTGACLEAWVRPSVVNSVRVIQCKRPSVNPAIGHTFFIDNPGVLRFIAWDAAGNIIVNLTSTATLTTSDFTHVAIDKDGNNYRLFVAGDLQDSATQAAAVGADSSFVIIGKDPTVTTRDWSGWIDEMRFTAASRYTDSFTPPTAAFPNS